MSNEEANARKKEARRMARVRIGELLRPFDLHGLGVYIPSAAAELMKMAEDFHKGMTEEGAGDR